MAAYVMTVLSADLGKRESKFLPCTQTQRTTLHTQAWGEGRETPFSTFAKYVTYFRSQQKRYLKASINQC